MTDPYADTIIPAFASRPFFEILSPERTRDKAWRWQLKAGTGEIVAQGEPHHSKETCLASINRVKASAAGAEIR